LNLLFIIYLWKSILAVLIGRRRNEVTIDTSNHSHKPEGIWGVGGGDCCEGKHKWNKLKNKEICISLILQILNAWCSPLTRTRVVRLLYILLAKFFNWQAHATLFLSGKTFLFYVFMLGYWSFVVFLVCCFSLCWRHCIVSHTHYAFLISLSFCIAGWFNL